MAGRGRSDGGTRRRSHGGAAERRSAGHDRLFAVTPTDTPLADPPLHARSFTLWPAASDLSSDTVNYGPDGPVETEVRLLGSVENKRVLELGCGAGVNAVALARQGARVTAIDESADQLVHGRGLADQHELRVEWRTGDPADLAALRADTIDAALSVFSLATVDDLGRVFRQVHRVLRSGAPLVISVPHPAYQLLQPDTLPPVLRRNAYDTSLLEPSEEDQPGEHVRSISELFTTLSRSNFRVDTILEPRPIASRFRSRYWRDAMDWVPPVLVIRARKLGT
jgi:SAM-dependent methyltransferase